MYEACPYQPDFRLDPDGNVRERLCALASEAVGLALWVGDKTCTSCASRPKPFDADNGILRPIIFSMLIQLADGRAAAHVRRIALVKLRDRHGATPEELLAKIHTAAGRGFLSEADAGPLYDLATRGDAPEGKDAFVERVRTSYSWALRRAAHFRQREYQGQLSKPGSVLFLARHQEGPRYNSMGLGDLVMHVPALRLIVDAGWSVDVEAAGPGGHAADPLWSRIGARAVTPETRRSRYDIIASPTEAAFPMGAAAETDHDFVVCGSPAKTPGPYLDCARRLGCEGEPEKPPLGRLPAKLGTPQVIVIAPDVAARGDRRKMVDGAKWLEFIERAPLPCVIVGKGNADLSWADEAPCENLVGKTKTVADLIPVFERAALVVGVEGGLIHLAAAFGIPTLTAFTVTRPDIFTPFGNDLARAADGVESSGRDLANLTGEMLREIAQDE